LKSIFKRAIEVIRNLSTSLKKTHQKDYKNSWIVQLSQMYEHEEVCYEWNSKFFCILIDYRKAVAAYNAT
jgi:hypothetical protein